jgi:hypothetical protein
MTAPTEPDHTLDVEALRAERDELRSEVDVLKRRTTRRGAFRRVVVGFLVVVSCLSLVAGVIGGWARRNFLDTDRFVDRVGPLIDEPSVQEALTVRLTDQLMTLIDPRELFREALPERGQILAVPLANAVEGFVRDRVASFVQSDEFERLWVGAATLAHEAAVRVLEGESEAVLAENGRVTLNLLPAVNAVLQRVTAASPEILGREVDLPDVSVDDVPDVVIARLEDRLGVDLDDGFGRFTVYDQGRLEAVQDGVELFDRLVVVSLPAGLLLAGLAVWLSKRRRRTLLQLSFGLALGMILIRRSSFRLQDDVAALPPTSQGRRAAGAALEQFLQPLTTFAAWTLAALCLIAAVAVLTGDYPWVVGLRRRVAALWARATGTAAERARDEATVAWVRDHRDGLLVLGALGGLALLWATTLSWAGLLLVLGLVGAFELVVYRVGAPTSAT